MERKPLGMLVGVDGSEAGLRAVDWAAADAAGTGAGLTVCAVCDVPFLADVPVSEGLRHDALRYGRKVVDRGLVRARYAAPSVRATGTVVWGNPTAELLRMSAEAEQVVLGSRGAGGFDQLVIGSVGSQVAAHADCSVVVVRGDERPGHPVVVGVDGSVGSERALEYAFGHACRHGLTLQAVYARPVAVPVPPLPQRAWMLPSGLHRRAEQLLEDKVGPWMAKYPGVAVESTVVEGSAAWVLCEAAKGAAVVVVGSRGHGGFTGLLLGSVGQALLRHATCPVAVVR